jgi:hypothetical protein
LRGKQEKMQDARMKKQQIVCDFKLNKNAIETYFFFSEIFIGT